MEQARPIIKIKTGIRGRKTAKVSGTNDLWNLGTLISEREKCVLRCDLETGCPIFENLQGCIETIPGGYFNLVQLGSIWFNLVQLTSTWAQNGLFAVSPIGVVVGLCCLHSISLRPFSFMLALLEDYLITLAIWFNTIRFHAFCFLLKSAPEELFNIRRRFECESGFVSTLAEQAWEPIRQMSYPAVNAGG